MKQVREVRTFEASKHRDEKNWFSRKVSEPIHCICLGALQQFWSIYYEPKIEIVLTNWNVKHSVRVTLTRFLLEFESKMVCCTPAQWQAAQAFLNVHEQCFMYVNVVRRNGQKWKVVKI